MKKKQLLLTTDRYWPLPLDLYDTKQKHQHTNPNQTTQKVDEKASTHLLNRNILSTLSIPDMPHAPSGNCGTTVLAHARHIHRPHEPPEQLNVHPILLREPTRFHSIVPSTSTSTSI